MPGTSARAAPLLACLVLSACGGGGGGGGSSTAAPAAVPVDLGATNMEPASSTTLTAAEVGSVPPADISDFVTGSQLQVPGPDGAAIRGVLVGELMSLAGTALADAASGITLTRSEDCSQSGSVGLAITDNNNGQLDAGDSVVADFDACDNGDGLIDGRVTLTLRSLSGDFSPDGSASADARFESLRVTRDGGSVTATGDMRISLVQDASNLHAEYVTTTVRYDLAGPLRQGTLVVTNGVVVTDESPAATRSSLSETVTASLPRFSGTLALSTPQPIVTLPSGEVESGRLEARGRTGAVALTFLGGGQVLLELDADGDATAEVSRSLVLTELELNAF